MSKMNVNDHLSSHMAKLFSSWAKVQQKSAKNLVSVAKKRVFLCVYENGPNVYFQYKQLFQNNCFKKAYCIRSCPQSDMVMIK